MKFNYLFEEQNNGHYKSYRPFSSSAVLSQEQVTEWLSAIPGVERTGAGIDHLCEIMESMNIEWEIFHCPCCSKTVTHLDENKIYGFVRSCESIGIAWVKIKGISGNY